MGSKGFLGEEAQKERDRWLDACFSSLCSQYDRERRVTLGLDMLEYCDHEFCKGVVDVLRRAVGATYYGDKRPDGG